MALKTFVIVIKVNGKTVESLPGAKLMFGGYDRKPLTVNGRAGEHFTEEPQPGGCSFKIAHSADTDVDEVRNWKGVTLQAYCDSGPVYQMAGAYTSKPVELSDGDGGMTVEMAGPPWEEI